MRQNLIASARSLGHTLFAKKTVAEKNESLRLSVPLLGFRQLRSKLLAGRHTSTVDARRREAQTLLATSPMLLLMSPRTLQEMSVVVLLAQLFS